MRSVSASIRRSEPWLTLLQASRQEGVGVRTLERWRAEGMTVRWDGNRLVVNPVHVRAWRRWKSLQNDAHRARRAKAAEAGVRDAVVSEAAIERARREWIAAGGREAREA